MRKAADVAAESLSEKDFMASVIKVGELFGWLCYHTYDARRSERGFPDLVMVRPPRVLFVELKAFQPSTKRWGRPSPAQVKWLTTLGRCDGVESYCWDPRDWQEIARVLGDETARSNNGRTESH